MQRVFTTGQVAKVFSVNINTVIKWFDEGKLEGFRLPRSNERRIYRESVLRFMKEHGISTELLNEFDEAMSARKRARKSHAVTPRGTRDRVGTETRVFPRKNVELSARIHSPDTADEEARVRVRNLSMGGAYLIGFAPKSKAIPEEFRIRVEANDTGPGLDGTCQVIHAHRAEDQTYAFGVRFTRVDPGSLQTYLVG